MFTSIPKSGPQDVKDVPFSTTALESVLSTGTVAQFNDLMDRAKTKAGDLDKSPGQEVYRLGQFTSNRHRIGQMYANRVPGVRRFSVDYAAHAYQTSISQSGLRILAQVAEDVIVQELSEPPKQKSEKGKKQPKGHRVIHLRGDPDVPALPETKPTNSDNSNTNPEDDNND